MTPRDRDKPLPPVSSEAWTGRLPEAHVAPPRSPAQRDRLLSALLWMGAILSLWVGWWFVLSLHAPSQPDPETGRIVALKLRQQDGPLLFVRPWEAAVAQSLAMAAVVLPAVRLAWSAIRERRRR